jgi:hypothetical protein
MQSWSGGADVTTGQMIVAETRVICSTSCSASLTVPDLGVDIPFAIGGNVPEYSPPDCVAGIEAVALLDGISARVTICAPTDTTLTATWTVASGTASLESPSLTVE